MGDFSTFAAGVPDVSSAIRRVSTRSIALALKGACRSLSGYDVDPSTIAQAIDRGIIRRPIDLRGDEVDLLLLATPVSGILDWLGRVPSIFLGEFHLLDLGSTKSQIVARMRLLPERISPLGGHPMCGKEASGLGVAGSDLYQGSGTPARDRG